MGRKISVLALVGAVAISSTGCGYIAAGTAVGAAGGAAIGSGSDEGVLGAVIGGSVGLLAGTVVGFLEMLNKHDDDND